MTGGFLRAVGRNMAIAALLAIPIVLLVPRRDTIAWDYLEVFTVAFCFAIAGHFAEVAALSLADIGTGWGRLVRMGIWFAAGLWALVIARWLWVRYGRDLHGLPPLIWGGVAMVVLELLVHAGLKRAGKPSFYD